jgi:hypothetical protein
VSLSWLRTIYTGIPRRRRRRRRRKTLDPKIIDALYLTSRPPSTTKTLDPETTEALYYPPYYRLRTRIIVID